jgi:predicted RNA binding protein YcfA (HicA-like mRNA interferase family)
LKRREFIKELIKSGCYLKRHGSRHDLYVNPTNGKKAPIPRHQELKDTLCKLIKKQLGLEE